MGDLDKKRPSSPETVNTALDKKNLCLRESLLSRNILASQIEGELVKNLPESFKKRAPILLRGLIENGLDSTEKINKFLNEKGKNLKSLILGLGETENGWQKFAEGLFKDLKLSKQKRNFMIGKSLFEIKSNASEQEQKNWAVYRALIQIISSIAERLRFRVFFEGDKPSINQLSAGFEKMTPETLFFAAKIRDYLKSKKQYDLKSLHNIVNKNALNLYRLLNTLGLTKSVVDGLLNDGWFKIYNQMGLTPYTAKGDYRPDHKLVTVKYRESNNFKVQQRRALLNALLNILSYLENCIPFEKRSSEPVSLASKNKGVKTPLLQKTKISSSKPASIEAVKQPSSVIKKSEAGKEKALKPKRDIGEIERQILAKFPKFNSRINIFATNFEKAKTYLTSKRFLGNLKKNLKGKYSEYLSFYNLAADGINIEDYLALVFKESTFRKDAKTSSGKAVGYFQLYGNQAKNEVCKKFKFARINGRSINLENPVHNIIIGILYHKILLHKKTNFSAYGLKFKDEDRLKVAKLMYNLGYDKIRKIIVNIKPALNTYQKLEEYLNKQLCFALGGCSQPLRDLFLHKETKTRYSRLNALKKFAQLKNSGDEKVDNDIYINFSNGSISLQEPEDGNYISISAEKLREALEYVQVISAIENRRSLPNSLKSKEGKILKTRIARRIENLNTRSKIVYTKKLTAQIQNLDNAIQPLVFSKMANIRKLYLLNKDPQKNKKEIDKLKQKINGYNLRIRQVQAGVDYLRITAKTNPRYQPFLLSPGTGRGEQLNFEIPLANKFNIPRLWSLDVIDALKKRGELIPALKNKDGEWVSENGLYTVSSSSFASDYKPYFRKKWKMDEETADNKAIEYFANLRPSTKEFLDKFAKYYSSEAHKKVLAKLGVTQCPQRPDKLLLGSMARTRLYQKFVQKKHTIAGKVASGHEFGHTFDISEKSFENKGRYQRYYTLMRREMIIWMKEQEKIGYEAYKANSALAVKNKIMLVQYTAEVRGRRFHITAFYPENLKSTAKKKNSSSNLPSKNPAG